jgi:hypothetical protein
LNLANNVYLHGQTHPARTALVIDDDRYSYARFATAAGHVANVASRPARRVTPAGASTNGIFASAALARRHLSRRDR